MFELFRNAVRGCTKQIDKKRGDPFSETLPRVQISYGASYVEFSVTVRTAREALLPLLHMLAVLYCTVLYCTVQFSRLSSSPVFVETRTSLVVNRVTVETCSALLQRRSQLGSHHSIVEGNIQMTRAANGLDESQNHLKTVITSSVNMSLAISTTIRDHATYLV